MKLTELFVDFFKSKRAAGLVLIICTVLSLALANLYPPYSNIWQTPVGSHTIVHWVNDGLMAIFFLLIGLELEREIYVGELSDFKTALFPLMAAIGGMVFPAAIYLAFNWTDGDLRGFGIPMATDIAFALGALSLLGNRIPSSLKIFLTAFAVVDDLGAIVIIALFYTESIVWMNIVAVLTIFFILLLLNRRKVTTLWIYLLLGFGMWYFTLHSGVHATITGVLLAFAIPFGKGDKNSASFKLQHFLHRPVAFIILPLFALANTAIPLTEKYVLASMVSLGIMSGLLIGKPLGIFLFSFLSVKSKICVLPIHVNWYHIFGAGLLGGIGFTMSIFVTLLAFDDGSLVNNSKISVIIISLTSGVIGLAWLRFISTKNTEQINKE